MLIALSAKNKVCFVDGSLPKPSVFESYFNAWVPCNDLVVSWILNFVSKEIYNTVIYITSAKDMWQDLKDRYTQKNGPRVFQLQKAISVIAQENSFVSNYFTRIKPFGKNSTTIDQFLFAIVVTVVGCSPFLNFIVKNEFFNF